ncbi:MAG: hypothetical protein LC720_02040 [Actinobacteria bacterium]|nr:hypothetical protein [Actinomycetota bacterium]
MLSLCVPGCLCPEPAPPAHDPRRGSPAVFNQAPPLEGLDLSFCAGRLAGEAGREYGTLPAGTDFGAIVARHRPVPV